MNLFGLERSDMAPWVPDSVARVALAYPNQFGALPLLRDPRMESVWDYLRRRKVPPESAKSLLVSLNGPAMWKVSEAEMSPADIACATLYVCILGGFNDDCRIISGAEADQMAKPFREAARLCREQMADPFLPINKAELMKALEMVGRHFDSRASAIEEDLNVVARSSRARGDDRIRVGVRRIAWATKTLFGSTLYTIVAKIATVTLGVTVTAKQVENWTKNVRPL